MDAGKDCPCTLYSKSYIHRKHHRTRFHSRPHRRRHLYCKVRRSPLLFRCCPSSNNPCTPSFLY